LKSQYANLRTHVIEIRKLSTEHRKNHMNIHIKNPYNMLSTNCADRNVWNMVQNCLVPAHAHYLTALAC